MRPTKSFPDGRPEVLLNGEHALAARAPAPDDELLDAQLARLDRKSESADAERRRLIDLYQAGLIELVELQRRTKELDTRRHDLERRRAALADQRRELATDNRLRQRVGSFAQRASTPSTASTSNSGSDSFGSWSNRSRSQAGR